MNTDRIIVSQFRERIIKVEKRVVGDINPNERNPKVVTSKKQNELTAVLGEFGKVGVLLTYFDDDGIERFFDGHARKKARGDEVWWVAQTDLTQKEVDDLVMLYDPLAAPDWDAELFKQLVKETAVTDETLTAMMDEIEKRLSVASASDWSDAFGGLPIEDRSPFQQMTFTLHDSQVESVKEALSISKGIGGFDSENENSNGNALARICEVFISDYGQG